jgi:glutathione S-transferase
MYSLHIGNKNYSSWSLRPWLLMQVLGIPFTEHQHRFPEGSAFELFRAFSPNGLVPALHDGDTVVWDSLAIVEYLAERHGGVWAADPVARAWSRSASAEMHSGFAVLRQRCTMSVGLRITLNGVPPALQKDIDRVAELWSEGIARFGGPFLAGRSFTAVDALYAPVAFRAQTYGILKDAVSAAYVAHLLALPAMRAWYEAGISETWRESGHEAEARATGTWTADLRAPGV